MATLRSSSKNDSNTGTALSVTAPSGATTGDLVVCLVQANGQTTIVDNNGSTPFTEDINDYKPNTTNGHTVSVFSRVIQAGDPGTYNFTSGASGRWSVVAICWQGAHTYDVAPSTANAANDDTASTGTINAPTITTVVNNSHHVTFCCWDTSATGTITTPSGYTLLQNANSGGEPLHASYKNIATAGATGATQHVNTEFGAMIAMSFSVKASGGTVYDIVAAAGSFSLTGQGAGVTFQAKVVSDKGDFTLSGQAMNPLFGPKVTADQGSFSLLGQNAGLNYGTTLALERGIFTLTGQDVTLQNGYGIIAEQGSYTLSGQDVALNMALTEILSPGSFALTGQDMTPRYGTSMTANQGAFTLTGQDANFTTQYVILTATGGFVLTGQNAGTLFGAVMSGATGAFTLNGIDTAFPIAYTISAEKGTITLTGNNAGLNLSSPSGVGNIIIGIAL